jgi:hypothetical protein
MTSKAQKTLVDFVIRRAFEPVLRANPEGRPDAEKRKLADVQDATRATIERYKHYGSAAEVATNFKRDLTSDAAKRVHRQLRSLHLPTIDDIREEFDEKTRELGLREHA